ncbi:MAG: hypothetical protein IM488_18300 [Microcystis sp. M025S2]|nr:hypothetical protein [Microcystis sp. M025S2]
MALNLRQIDPVNKATNYQKSYDESTLPIKKKQTSLVTEFDENVIGDFALAGAGVGAGIFGGAALLGFPLAGAVLAPVGAAVGAAIGSVVGAETALAVDVIRDPEEVVDRVKGTVADTLDYTSVRLDEAFGVTAEQGGSSNDPMTLDESDVPFGVEASQNTSTYQPSKDESAPPLRTETLPALDKSAEASMSWIA